MNLKFRIKTYIKYILINLAALISIIFTFFLFKLLRFKKIIDLVKNISLFFIKNFRKRVDFKSIFYLSNKMNENLGIDSCFRICISQKITLSIFGYDADVVCGVRSSNDKSIDGHAWIVYKGKPILKQNEKIDNYVKSFVI